MYFGISFFFFFDSFCSSILNWSILQSSDYSIAYTHLNTRILIEPKFAFSLFNIKIFISKIHWLRTMTMRTGNMLMDEGETKKPVAHNPLEQFLLLAKGTKGAACQDLIKTVLEAPGVYVFSELLDQPNIREVNTPIQTDWCFNCVLFIAKKIFDSHTSLSHIDWLISYGMNFVCFSWKTHRTPTTWIHWICSHLAHTNSTWTTEALSSNWLIPWRINSNIWQLSRWQLAINALRTAICWNNWTLVAFVNWKI